MLEVIREPALFDPGKEKVLRQLADLGSVLLSRHRGIRKVGVASAGPLDPRCGILLNPTNFASSKGSWGRVPITKILGARLKLPVFLKNDAAAAVLAKNWVGVGKQRQNIMILKNMPKSWR